MAELDAPWRYCVRGPDENHLVLWKLYVLPEYQGQGIGSALMESVVASATGVHPEIRISYRVGNAHAEAYRPGALVEIGRESGGDGIPDSAWNAARVNPKEQ